MLTTHSEEKAKQLENESMTLEEENKAKQEAHEHFVAVEFSELVLNEGPTYMLNKLTKDAKEELIMALQGEK